MSWDASFDGRDWNYTHNTNRMIAAAYEAQTGIATADVDNSVLGPIIGPAWWKRLEGMTGKEGAEYLGIILTGLQADPQRYRAMNPPNGWGSYDKLLAVLDEMCEVSVTACCETRRWEISG